MHVLIIIDAVSYRYDNFWIVFWTYILTLPLALLIAAGPASESSIEHITFVMNIALINIYTVPDRGMSRALHIWWKYYAIWSRFYDCIPAV